MNKKIKIKINYIQMNTNKKQILIYYIIIGFFIGIIITDGTNHKPIKLFTQAHHEYYGYDKSYVPAILDKTMFLGTGTKFDFSWRALEPNPTGNFDPNVLQDFIDTMDKAKAIGMKVTVLIDQFPSWLVGIANTNKKRAIEKIKNFSFKAGKFLKKYEDVVSYVILQNEMNNAMVFELYGIIDAPTMIDAICDGLDNSGFDNIKKRIVNFDAGFGSTLYEESLPYNEQFLNAICKSKRFHKIGIDFYNCLWTNSSCDSTLPLQFVFSKVSNIFDSCYGKKFGITEFGYSTPNITLVRQDTGEIIVTWDEYTRWTYINSIFPALINFVNETNNPGIRKYLKFIALYELFDAGLPYQMAQTFPYYNGVYPPLDEIVIYTTELNFGIFRNDFTEKLGTNDLVNFLTILKTI